MLQITKSKLYLLFIFSLNDQIILFNIKRLKSRWFIPFTYSIEKIDSNYSFTHYVSASNLHDKIIWIDANYSSCKSFSNEFQYNFKLL